MFWRRVFIRMSYIRCKNAADVLYMKAESSVIQWEVDTQLASQQNYNCRGSVTFWYWYNSFAVYQQLLSSVTKCTCSVHQSLTNTVGKLNNLPILITKKQPMYGLDISFTHTHMLCMKQHTLEDAGRRCRLCSYHGDIERFPHPLPWAVEWQASRNKGEMMVIERKYGSWSWGGMCCNTHWPSITSVMTRQKCQSGSTNEIITSSVYRSYLVMCDSWMNSMHEWRERQAKQWCGDSLWQYDIWKIPQDT